MNKWSRVIEKPSDSAESITLYQSKKLLKFTSWCKPLPLLCLPLPLCVLIIISIKWLEFVTGGERLMIYSQAPLSMGFSRQKYWSGLPCPPPEDLPNPGIEPMSLHWQTGSLSLAPPGKP